MLNKNANYYNIEKNFKYSTRISTFSEHITIQTLSVDILQLKFQQRQKKWLTFITNFLLSNFSSFWLKPLWNQKLLLLTATVRCSAFSNVELFNIFSQTFLELIFSAKIKTMLLKQSAVLFTSYQKNITYIICLNT